MHTTSIRLSDEIKHQLDEVAAFRDRKPHWVMVKAIEHYLAQETEEIRWFRERVEAMEKDIAEDKMIPLDEAFAELRRPLIEAKKHADS